MWSRRSIEILVGATLLAAMAACSVMPRQAAPPAAAAAVVTPPVPPPIPEAATAEFDKALALARAGNGDEAEAQLTELSRQYPQFSTPLVDLGILRRKSGNLDAAAKAFQQAVARDPHSALAWTELGVTQRMAGKFQDAEQSYAHAIAADSTFAPAWRDRGVLRDLYLDQPAAALGDFEQYRKLTGDDKPVAMWIAELEHRTGIKEPPPAQHPATSPGVSAQSTAPVSTAPPQQPQARN
jgi:tetratricopeptide (TPR) repeat protein